jgi:Flp pilus assembly protein TadD
MKIRRTTTLACCTFIVALFTPLLQAASARQWVEVRSPHFSVMTDCGEKRGKEVALRFEQMRAVFSIILQQKDTRASAPLEILVFRNSQELRAYAPLWQGKPIELAGLFAPGQDRQFIALDLSNEQNWQAIAHEYSHHMLHADLPHVPLWLDEGFAEYYSSILFTPKAVELGRPSEATLQVLKAGRMPLDKLFSVTRKDEVYNENHNPRHLFYAQSWLAMHFLLDNNLIYQTQQYVALADSGMSTRNSIRRAFSMEPEQLQASIEHYLQSSQMLVRRIPLPQNLEELEFTARPMSDADSRVLLADLHLHSPDYVDMAIEEYRAILHDYPDHAGAHRGLGYALLHRREFEQAGSEFRAAAVNSNDPLVYYYSALAVVRGGGKREELDEAIRQLEKALSLKPDFAEAHCLLGVAQMTRGETRSALESLRHAVKLNPKNELYRSNLAQCLMADAQYEGAEALLSGLMASKEPGTAASARNDLEKLNRLRQQQDRLRKGPAVNIATHEDLPVAAPTPENSRIGMDAVTP